MTTLTTFLGLAPMILETSRQARFMIPMAISLGFCMLFATVILLLVVPCLYLGFRKPTRTTQQTTQSSHEGAKLMKPLASLRQCAFLEWV